MFRRFHNYFRLPLLLSSIRFSSSSSSSSSVLDDFLNEDLEDVQPLQQQKSSRTATTTVNPHPQHHHHQTKNPATLTPPLPPNMMMRKPVPAPPKSQQLKYQEMKQQQHHHQPNKLSHQKSQPQQVSSSTQNRNTTESAKSALESGGLVSAFAPTSSSSSSPVLLSSHKVHSLSEFLTAMTELVKTAKISSSSSTATTMNDKKNQQRHQSDESKNKNKNNSTSTTKQEMEAFWNLNVPNVIEMNCRSTHDLACVARAGRGFGLTIPDPSSGNSSPTSSSSSPTHHDQTKNAAAAFSAVYAGWSMISRFQNVTGCQDAISAVCLLVRSQPLLPPAPSPYQSIDDDALAPKYKSLSELHASHQRLAMEQVRYFFVASSATDTSKHNNNNRRQQQNINNNSKNQIMMMNKMNMKFNCPSNDYESLVDCLTILDMFSNSKRKLFWPVPPKHIHAKFWENVSNIMKYAVPTCSESLSFSQLVQCLRGCKKLYISCNYLLHEEEEEEMKLLEKLKRTSSKEGGKGGREGGLDSSSSLIYEKSKSTRRHLKRALRNARQDISFSGSIALLKMIVAQAVTLDKFVNSYHFSEVVDAVYVMNFHRFIDDEDDTNGQNSNNSKSSDIGDIKYQQLVVSIEEVFEMLQDTFKKRVEEEKVWKFDEKSLVRMKRILRV